MIPSSWRLALLPIAATALTFDCNHIRADGVDFDLSALGGPKDVHLQHWVAQHAISNTTFTFDMCKNLAKPSYTPSDEDFCSKSTRVCGVERVYNQQGSFESSVVEIAGEYTATKGRGLEPKFTRLKDSDSHSDSAKEGVRVELNGGKSEDGQRQSAIFEFVCDSDWVGNEGFEDAEEASLVDALEFGDMQTRRAITVREEGDAEEGDGDGDDGEHELPNLDAGKALEFVSYKVEHNVKVLRVTWKSKYACENAINEPGESKPSASWGFFTWLLIVVFLLAAAYIIFGSWLNYNRYGARGWDLIPHGDTIRDFPYIVKDWSTSVMDKVRGNGGGGSRGGYSAV